MGRASGIQPDADQAAKVDHGGRNACLDGIRGIAILFVILGHTFQYTQAHSRLGSIVTGIAGIGWVGVDLFFALSGFLITGILLRMRGTPDYFKVFYMRRFFRIFPLYYTFLAGLSALFLLTRPDLFRAIYLPWQLAYLSNFHVAMYGFLSRPVDHLWSLSVEEQFYIVWPAALLALPRRRTVTWILVFLAGLAAARLSVDALFHPWWEFDYALLHLDGLLTGAALAAYSQLRAPTATLRRAAWGVLAASVLALSGWFIRNGGLDRTMFHGIWTLNYTLVAAASTALIAVSIWTRPGAILNRALAMKPLARIGKYSYSMYIFHLPADWAFRTLKLAPSTVPGSLVYFTAVTGLCYAMALITWRLVEEPCLKLKERWYPYRKPISGPPRPPIAVTA